MTEANLRDLPAAPGTYVMIMQAVRGFDVVAGGLGRRHLRRGWYGYVGSAFGPGGLAARCGRHARRHKALRWHLDYLAPHLRVADVWYAPGSRRFEHEWASALGAGGSFAPGWPRFGASDCRCTTHLWYSEKRPSLAAFRRLVDDPGICAAAPEEKQN